MSWLEGSRARLRLLFNRGAAESRMTKEIGFHVDMETERLVREQGLEAVEARRRMGEELVDRLADISMVDWQGIGLGGMARSAKVHL